MKPKIGMKQLHVNIPDEYFGKLCDLVREDIHPNLSDAVRTSVRELLEEKGIYDIEKFEKYKQG